MYTNRKAKKGRSPPKNTKTARKTPKVNANAIVSLSKQIQSLKMSSLGLYQKNAETFAWIKSADAGAHQWTDTHPMCFSTNQFLGGLDVNLDPTRAPIFKTGSGYLGYEFRNFAQYNSQIGRAHV